MTSGESCGKPRDDAEPPTAAGAEPRHTRLHRFGHHFATLGQRDAPFLHYLEPAYALYVAQQIVTMVREDLITSAVSSLFPYATMRTNKL